MFAYVALGITFLYSREYLQNNGLLKGEFFVLGLFGLLGIMIMISAHSMLTLYLGLEVLALSQYTLVAFNRDSALSAEAAMKYFVLGAIASGTLLYGISLLYGITGTLQLDELAARVGASDISVPALLALAFIVVGVAFKFGAVPFHMWLPDVYQGAPTPVTLFIGSVPKLASFALVWRVLSEGLGPLHDGGWRDMLIVLCVLSLGIGNLVAIAQTNIKRMLAYSTISHVGFIFMGFIAGNGRRALGRDVLHVRLRADGGRGLRHGHPPEPPRLRSRAPRGLQGLERAQPVVRARHADDHVQHGRRAAVRRLLREAGRAASRARCRASCGSRPSACCSP